MHFNKMSTVFKIRSLTRDFLKSQILIFINDYRVFPKHGPNKQHKE